MSYNILPTSKFSKEIKRLIKKFPSLKSEFANLISLLSENPTTGTSLGENCFKIRIAIASKNKGKSGGARIITYLILKDKSVFLLTIYDKAEKQNITEKELKELILIGESKNLVILNSTVQRHIISTSFISIYYQQKLEVLIGKR